MKNCFYTNNYVYLALLQICSMPIGPGILNPAALMFNRFIRGVMQNLSRPPILFNDDDDHYAALIERQQNSDKNNNTCKRFPFLPTKSFVAEQMEDGCPLMHGMVVEHGSEEHNHRPYHINMTTTGCIITRTQQYMKHKSIQAEDYLCDELKKRNTHKQATD